MRPRAALAALLAVGLTGVFACRDRAQADPPAAEAPAPRPMAAWSWHPLGGLAVVEGEVAEATDLVLEGRSVRETRYAEPGPVRWEFFRPPEGEPAVLRTAEGRELARFRFSTEPPPGEAPKRAKRENPPPASPAQKAPPPQVRSQAHLRPVTVPPVAERQPPPSFAPQARATPRPIPVPELRPEEPRVRSQARLQGTPVPPLARRTPPSAPAPVPEPQAQASPARSRLPELRPEAPRVRSQAHLRAAPVPSLAERRPPVPFEAPRTAPEPEVRRDTPIPVPRLRPEPSAPIPAPPAARALPWPGMGEALNLTHGPAGRKRLLLSFDGGSNAEVATEILDTLKARGVRTTIFLTGAFIQQFPALVRRMDAEGHELGNHTMNHPHFAPGMKRDPKWTRDLVQRELLEADAALVRLLGRPMDPYWRAPYGEHTAEIRRWAEELGYRHIGWSEGADTLDWATPKERRLYRTGDAILKRLQQRLDRDGDGLIVLMHLGSERQEGDRPSAGLGAFMDRAGRAGWSFVPVGTFLKDLGKPAWDPQRRMALLHPPAPAGGAR